MSPCMYLSAHWYLSIIIQRHLAPNQGKHFWLVLPAAHRFTRYHTHCRRNRPAHSCTCTHEWRVPSHGWYGRMVSHAQNVAPRRPRLTPWRGVSGKEAQDAHDNPWPIEQRPFSFSSSSSLSLSLYDVRGTSHPFFSVRAWLGWREQRRGGT